MLLHSYRRNLVLCFLVFFVTLISAQERLTGLPFIENYEDELVDDLVAPGSVQGPNGYMFFSSSNGVLKFNGNTWEYARGTDTIGVTGICNYNNKAIYVAAKKGFGVLKSDSLGCLQYKSLNHIFQDTLPIENIVSIAAIDTAVIFVTQKELFFYYPEDVILRKLSYPNTRFKGLKTSNNRIFLEMNDLLVEMKSDTFDVLGEVKNSTLFSIHTDANNREVFVFYPFSMHQYADGKLQKWNDRIEEKIGNDVVLSTLRLKNDHYLFSTYSRGILEFDKNGDFLRKISTNEGLGSSIVVRIFEDKGGSVWANLAPGVCRIEIQSPFQYYDDRSGTNNSTFNWYRRYNDVDYFGLFDGVYERKEGRLYKIDKLEDLYTSPFVFGYSFLMNSNGGMIQYFPESNELKRISKLQAATIIPVSKDTLIIHSYNKFYRAYFNKGKFETEFISALSDSIKNYELFNNGSLIAFRNGKEIYRYYLSKNYLDIDSLISFKLPVEEGIESKASVIALNNSIKVSSIEGFYEQKSYDGSFQKNELLSEYCSLFERFVKIREYDSIYYLFDNKKIIAVSDKSGKDSVIQNRFRKINDQLMDATHYYGLDTILISSKDGFIVYNPGAVGGEQYGFNCYIDKVSISSKNLDSVIFAGARTGSMGSYIAEQVILPVIDYDHNSLKFYFTSNFYENRESIEFSSYLENYDADWSAWSGVGFREYTNLPEGDYILKVRSRNIYHTISSVDSYHFTILPPWYRTLWAYILYLITAGIFVFIIVKLNTRRLEKQKKELEKIVKQRTAEVVKQKEEIQEQANELEYKNVELQQQKEEILAQTEQLELANTELEKLSIVAQETDNSVIITDENGIIEWANAGFTKLYGYSIEEFKMKYGENLIAVSNFESFHSIFIECIDKKESITYESQMHTKDDAMIWTQTTLTPIFDIDGNLKKLIAVDSDITKVKHVQEEITNSINYARVIQDAILPSDKFIREVFPESFVFYKPKDIVSGDFYWLSRKENKIYIAVADCTGHGVPGAFMSMIGNTLLNDIVTKDEAMSPALVLEKLNKGVEYALNRNVEDVFERKQDGMDITVCCIDQMEKKLKIACANHFFYVKTDKGLEKHSGDIYSVGGMFGNRDISFSDMEFDLDQVHSIYMFSDGYIDQFGGLAGEKFMTARFESLLQANMHLNMDQQLKEIERSFVQWKGEEKQLDDVLLVGIQLNK